jgi:TonB family protein
MNRIRFALLASIALHSLLFLSLNPETGKISIPSLKIEVSVSSKSTKKPGREPTRREEGIKPSSQNSDDFQARNDIVSKFNKDLQNQMPYPPAAVKLGYEGKVLIEALIESEKAFNIKVIDSSGYKILDRQVIDTLSNWEFPSNFNGPISLTFEFSLN